MYLGITCFYHENEENGYLSNWYKAEFTYARRRFSSVEQYMMYHKALMFRDAIHAYTDTLIGDYERECFYSVPFSEWEIAMRTNMGGGLPAIGFWEMKQDIYDTLRYRG